MRRIKKRTSGGGGEPERDALHCVSICARQPTADDRTPASIRLRIIVIRADPTVVNKRRQKKKQSSFTRAHVSASGFLRNFPRRGYYRPPPVFDYGADKNTRRRLGTVPSARCHRRLPGPCGTRANFVCASQQRSSSRILLARKTRGSCLQTRARFSIDDGARRRRQRRPSFAGKAGANWQSFLGAVDERPRTKAAKCKRAPGRPATIT